MQVGTVEMGYTISGIEILRMINIDAESGQFIGIIGPNGSGKSTLLKCIYRVLEPSMGVVMLDGRNLSEYKIRDSAKKMAVLAQHAAIEFEFTALEMVLMGRSPHKKALEPDNQKDFTIARQALQTVGMTDFEERVFATLSGGERQRVMLAQALAQQTTCLILDEPTNHLDVRFQLETMDIVRGLGCTVIAAIHDLNIAAMYCDYIYVLNHGRVVSKGLPKEVLTVEMIKEVYEVNAQVLDDQAGGIHIIFRRRQVN
jgi:iron complex transport system ATP-binding protein